MNSQLRRILWLSLFSACSSLGVQACQKKDEGSVVPLVPPTLEFLGATTPAGVEFEPGSAIELGCDASLTFHLGPEGEEVGTIENWTFRPANVCGSLQQCGYIALEILDEDENVLETSNQLVAYPYVDFSGVDLSAVAEVRATLTLGDSGVPYQDGGIAVSASWQAELTSTCDNLGGAGGAGPGRATGGRSGTGGEEGTGGDAGTGGDNAMGGVPEVFGGAGGMGGSGTLP